MDATGSSNRPSPSSPQKTRSSKRPPSSSAGAATVLVVDDEESVRESTAAILRFDGFNVLEAADGAARRRGFWPVNASPMQSSSTSIWAGWTGPPSLYLWRNRQPSSYFQPSAILKRRNFVEDSATSSSSVSTSPCPRPS